MRTKHKHKLLFEEGLEASIFLSFVDNDVHRKIAYLLFVRGKTNTDVAAEVGYSVRQIERIRVQILTEALNNSIKENLRKVCIGDANA